MKKVLDKTGLADFATKLFAKVKAISSLDHGMAFNGAVSATSASVSGATTVGDTLAVTGATTVGDTLAVTGKATLNDDLDVVGDITADEFITIDAESEYNRRFGSLDADLLSLSHMSDGNYGVELRQINMHGDSVGMSTEIGGESYSISAVTDDMIWQEMTLASGITGHIYGGVPYDNDAQAYYKPMFRKVGDRVDICGSVKLTWDGSINVTIATLPAGFRPASTLQYLVATAGKNIAQIGITDGGVIRLELFVAISDGHNITTEQWVELNTSFFILNGNYIKHP